jgi:hypothetical protein
VRSNGVIATSTNTTPCLCSLANTTSTTAEVICGLNGLGSNTTATIAKRNSNSGYSGCGLRKVVLLSGQQLTQSEMLTVAKILMG